MTYLCQFDPHSRDDATDNSRTALLLQRVVLRVSKEAPLLLLRIHLSHSEQSIGTESLVKHVHTDGVHPYTWRLGEDLRVGA